MARKEHSRLVLVFQFDAVQGQKEPGSGSDFLAAYSFGEVHFRRRAQRADNVVAYLPQSIAGHALLPALACREIIMAKDATLGAAGIDETTIGPTVRSAYSEIAGQRRTVLAPVVLAMLDPAIDHIARMTAVALGLTVLENAIPSPLPGVKPGLANIVTLIVLARYGWRAAAWVSLLRVLAGSLLFGSFLAPGFFLSLSGALCSLAVLAISLHLPQRWFGPVTDSILAAFAHIAGQMTVVYLWLIPHSGIAYLIPVFATAALVFGTVNGLIAANFMDETQTPPPSGEEIGEKNRK